MPPLPRTTSSPRTSRHRFRAACELRTRRLRREVAYLGVTAVLGLVGLGLVVALAVVGPVLALSVIGLPLVGSAIVIARHVGALQREVVAWTVHRDVPPPARADRGTGLVRWTRSALTDRVGWRTLAYLVVHLPLVVASLAIGAAGLVAAALVLDPLWRLVAPPGWLGGSWVRTAGLAVGGALVLAVLPWVVRVVVRLDLRLVRSLLGATEGDAQIEQARTLAVSRAAAALRRLEEQDPTTDPTPEHATEPLTLDLRAGVRPAVVAEPPTDREPSAAGAEPRAVIDLSARDRAQRDRGLGQALACLAAGVSTPTRLHLDLNGTHVPESVKGMAEAAAIELVTNVERHSDAALAELSAVAGHGVLTVRVSDDGHGGARVADGTGLDRLTALIAPVRGQLVISSPAGGPTDITVALPLSAPEPEAAPAVDAALRTDGRPPRVVHRTDALATRRLGGIARRLPRRPVS